MHRETFDLIFGIILTFIVCLGVIGNVLSFLIWTKGRRSKKSPGGIYLRALDLADTFVLLICAADKAMALLGTRRLRRVNTFFCKLHKAGWHFGLLVSAWIVVCFTVERTIALGRPRGAGTTKGKTRWRSLGLVIFIYISTFLLNIPWVLGSELIPQPDQIYVSAVVNVTNTSDTYRFTKNTYTNISKMSESFKIMFSDQAEFCALSPSSFIYKHENAYHFWFTDFILLFSIPFTVIIICNTAILIMVIRQRKRAHVRRGSLVQGITARAVAVSTIHCISTGPFTIAILVPEFYKKAFIKRIGYQYYVGIVTVVCSYINNGANFILYSFFGTDFRRDFADLFRKKARIVPNEISTVFMTRTTWKRPFSHCWGGSLFQSSTESAAAGIPKANAKAPSVSYEAEA